MRLAGLVYLALAGALCAETAVSINQQGIELYRQGRKVLAIEKFREAIRIDPKLASAHQALGIALLDQRDLRRRSFGVRNRAKAWRRATLKHCGGSHALVAESTATQAAEAYRRLVSNQPSDFRARFEFGLALAQTGDVEQCDRFVPASHRLESWVRARPREFRHALCSAKANSTRQ